MGNKRFSSVRELVHETAGDEQSIKEFDKLHESRRLIRALMAIRASRKISQSDIAEAMGCTQSRVSKLESGRDSDLSFGDLVAYAEASGVDIHLTFIDNSQPIVERIKFHAHRIGKLLEELVALAQKDSTIARGVSGFFGEAFFNLLNILKQTGDSLPRKEDGSPMIKIDVAAKVIGESSRDDLTLRDNDCNTSSFVEA